ncbi:hypothetical protein [Rehaibacterium terrae]|uniref:Uncharacterized protein n=1 Tax=Rehaibacterium terrae TaxID=1341696 RepID=A0A7W8DEV9_9GAMM|nr:hypothetical protein [Rehaibacterium terrae]MBB5015977.1 hypothetical protein [Rehaibacterium terrae]
MALLLALWPGALPGAADCCPHAAAAAPAGSGNPMPCDDDMPFADCDADCALRCAAPTPIHADLRLIATHSMHAAGPAGRLAASHPRPAPAPHLRPPIAA